MKIDAMISPSAEQIASRLVDAATDINGGVRLYELKTAIAQQLTAIQGEIAIQAERARCFREEREIVQAALEQAQGEIARLKDEAAVNSEAAAQWRDKLAALMVKHEQAEAELKELKEFKHMIELERSLNKVSKFQCQCWWCKMKRRFK